VKKETRNLIIAIVVSLFVGFFAGSVYQTGLCPITGKQICAPRNAGACSLKDKEACEVKDGKACDKSDKSECCDKKEAAEVK